MAFPDAFLEDLKARLPVSEVVGTVLPLRREGREFRAVDDNSLTVNDDKKIWWDHAKDEGGDVFSFMVKHEGLDFRAAVERCAEIAGMGLPPDTKANGSAKANGPHQEEPPPWDPDSEPASSPAPPASSQREITATYDYTSGSGDLLYQVVRLAWTEDGKPKKTFLQRRPAPEPGKWIWGLSAGDYLKARNGDWYKATKDRLKKWTGAEQRTFEGCEHGLYRLVELREEITPDQPVFLPEGEKDANTLWEWGFPATTNSGGAANWRPEHTEAFRGQDVVIPVDNDEAGRKRGEVVAKSLHGVAKRIRVLDFAAVWVAAPKGADVTDWKRQREGTADELSEMVAALPEWRPAAFKSRFGALPFERLDDPGPEYEYIVDGLMTVGDKSVIGGPSRSGKSFLAMHKALATALPAVGIPFDFFGHKVMSPGLVIYQAGEGVRGIKKRIRAFRQHFGVPKDTRVPFVLLQGKVDLYRTDGDTLALIEEILGITALYDVPLRSIYIDTLATATGGADENSGKDMSAVMANVDKINLATGAHVCLVHHMNAAGTKLRGHTSVYANIDQVIMVTRDERTKVRTAVLDKQKDDEDGRLIRFELKSIEIGKRAADGKSITSCVCLEVGEKDMAARADAQKGFSLSDIEDGVFRALINALAEVGTPPPAGHPNIPPGVTVVPYRAWRDAYGRSAMIDEDEESAKSGTIKKRMQRAGAALQKFGIIGRDDPYIWWTSKPVRGFGKGVPASVSQSAQQSPSPSEGEVLDDLPF